MPATRSSFTATTIAALEGKRFVVIPTPARNNKKWTVTEERELIRMCRHEDNSVSEMADRLNRTPEAIRYRLLKIFAAHMEGREPTDENIQDVSDWLVKPGN